MKKTLFSLMAVVLCLGLMGGAFAYFSDVETSEGNTFTAGTLDLQVDLVKSTHTDAAGDPVGTPIQFAMKDLESGDVFFNWSDIKPGDKGEATISLHVDNDAWAKLRLISTSNHDNGLTEAEEEGNWTWHTDTDSGSFEGADSTDGEWNGELPNYLHVTLWRDDNGNNVKDAEEPYLIAKKLEGQPPIYTKDATLAQAFPDIFTQESDEWCRIPGYLEKSKTEHIGISWYVDSSAGNEIQSDSVAITMSFEVSQKRNQPTTPYTFMGEF